jgi:hypothetical protein
MRVILGQGPPGVKKIFPMGPMQEIWVRVAGFRAKTNTQGSRVPSIPAV